jgi:hypothetical protein
VSGPRLETPTDAELAEWEALAEAATPGLWRSTWDDPEPDEEPRFGEETTVEAVGREGPAAVVVGQGWYDGLHTTCRREDAAFIAAARLGWPRTLAALRAERARPRIVPLDGGAIEVWSGDPPHPHCYVPASVIDAARARLKPLELAVAAYRERGPAYAWERDQIVHLALAAFPEQEPDHG